MGMSGMRRRTFLRHALGALALSSSCGLVEGREDGPPVVLVYAADGEEAAPREELLAAAAILERRLGDLRLIEVEASVEGDGRIALRILGDKSEATVGFVRQAASMRGLLEFRIEAVEADLTGDADLKRERSRLEAWVAAHPERPLRAFRDVARDAGGPHPRIAWHARRPRLDAERGLSSLDRAVPLLRPRSASEDFGSKDLGRTFASQGLDGSPALGFELEAGRKEAFAEFTAAHVGRNLAVVLDGEVVMLASIRDRLPGAGQIEGRFTQAEVEALLLALRAEPLPCALRFVEMRR